MIVVFSGKAKSCRMPRGGERRNVFPPSSCSRARGSRILRAAGRAHASRYSPIGGPRIEGVA